MKYVIFRVFGKSTSLLLIHTHIWQYPQYIAFIYFHPPSVFVPLCCVCECVWAIVRTFGKVDWPEGTENAPMCREMVHLNCIFAISAPISNGVYKREFANLCLIFVYLCVSLSECQMNLDRTHFLLKYQSSWLHFHDLIPHRLIDVSPIRLHVSVESCNDFTIERRV